jgi:hypothetical protein
MNVVSNYNKAGVEIKTVQRIFAKMTMNVKCKESHEDSRSVKLSPDIKRDYFYFFYIVYSTIRNNFKI